MIHSEGNEVKQKRRSAQISIDWEHAFDVMSDFVAIIDTDYRLERMNDAMARKLNVTSEDTAGCLCYNVVENIDSPPPHCPLSEMLKDGLQHSAEIYEERLGGNFLVTVYPWYDIERRMAGCIHIAQDINRRKKAEEDLQRENELLRIRATTDMLTGICNRHKFYDFLHHEMDASRRYKHPLSLIMFDIDHFKQVNDTYGHLSGDDVLREIAQRVSDHVRDADIFARWGGEEFMILCPNSSLKSTRFLADKLRSLIAGHCFQFYPGKVTCSFGITEFRDRDTAESFTQRADCAMYRAKLGGRNRVEVETRG